MFWSFIARFRPVGFALPVLLAIAACGQSTQPTVTIAPTPTLEQSSAPEPTTPPLPAITLDFELPEGDPQKGFLAAIRYVCFGCHVDPESPSNGPRFESSANMPAILERGELRIAHPSYEGMASTNREYIIESIIDPEAHLIEGEWEEVMPTYLGSIIEDQDLADIIAWMGTLE